MGHSSIKDWIEEYAEERLSPEIAQDVEQHLAICQECQEHLKMIRLTQRITLASKLEDGPTPAPGLSQTVFQAIEQQKEAYLFWRPLRLVAVRAIPAMALLAIILCVFAYAQMTSLLNNADKPLLESYLDLPSNWGQEAAVFSETISQDPDRVVNTLMEGQSNISDSERERR